MSYSGEVISREAYEAVSVDPTAVLVDVRTEAEWQDVGVPEVERLVLVELTRGDGTPNPTFLEDLADRVTPDHTLYFLCRSGQRSRVAASVATGAGYSRSYNVSDGFEGHLDPHTGRRESGWKNENLPWREPT